MSHFDRWVGKVAVITGASVGIGAAIAERLVKEGLKVVGLARRKERIEELAKTLSKEKGKLYPIKTDLTKEKDILAAFKWVKENLGPIHILVNNAGVAYPTNSLIDGDTNLWQNILQLNVMGLCICTREAIRDMKANNVDGHIIHINSVAGHKVPHFPPLKPNMYGPSKYAVTALTETLRFELLDEKSKIKVSSVSPGAVATEMFDAFKGADNADPGNINLSEFPVLNAEDIAEAVYYVLATPPHVQIHELTIKPVGEII